MKADPRYVRTIVPDTPTYGLEYSGILINGQVQFILRSEDGTFPFSATDTEVVVLLLLILAYFERRTTLLDHASGGNRSYGHVLMWRLRRKCEQAAPQAKLIVQHVRKSHYRLRVSDIIIDPKRFEQLKERGYPAELIDKIVRFLNRKE